MRVALRNLVVCCAAALGVAAAQATDIVLLDGAYCHAVGEDVNVSVAGGRVSHFCNDGVALIGSLTLVENHGLVTRVAYDPTDAATIRDDALVALEVRGVTLADGDECLDAGRGATLAYSGERANYTCSGGGVLLGYFTLEGGQVYATRAAVMQGKGGISISGPERVLVKTLDASAPIVGVQWHLVSFGAGAPVAEQSAPTLLVQDGQAGGSTGCNRYFSGVAFGLDGAIGFGPAGATMMFCEGAMDQEQRFLGALAAVTSYTLTPAGELVLSGGEGELVFAR